MAIKITALTCPQCGAKLKIKETIAKVAHCEHCGYNFLLEKENLDKPSERPKPKPQNVNVSSEAIDAYLSKMQTKSKSTGKAGTAIVIAIILISTFLPVIIGLVAAWKADGGGTPTVPRVEARTKPETEIVRNFTGHVFGKNPDEVTVRDLATLQYLKVEFSNDNDDGYVFHYSTSNPLTSAEFSTDTYFYPASEYGDGELLQWQDFECFTGLVELDLQGVAQDIEDGNRDDDYRRTTSDCDLSALTNLQVYRGSYYQNLHNVTFANPAKIRHMSIRLTSAEDYPLLPAFTALESLECDYVAQNPDYTKLAQLPKLETLIIGFNVKDISWLSSLTHLKHLTFEGTAINDYSVLYGMPGLLTLKIEDAERLKDIGFVSNMPNLQVFSLTESEVISIQPLAGKLSLNSLYLRRNDDLKDYSALATLTSLTSLTAIPRDFEILLPDLSALTHLRQAEIRGESVGAIANCKTIEDLLVEGSVHCTELTGLENLTNLVLRGTLFEPEALHALTKLHSISMWSAGSGERFDSSSLFRHPTLQRLELVDSTLHLDLAYVGVNTTLKVLSLQNSKYTILNQGYEPQPFGNMADILANFHALEELYLPKAGLTSLDLVSAMPNLKILDISDNYVNDIGPAANLQQLKNLYYGGTPIHNISIVPQGVTLYNNTMPYYAIVGTSYPYN